MVIGSPQLGHSISVPAPDASTANSWSHFGQLKIRSIRGLSLADYKARIRRGGKGGKENFRKIVKWVKSLHRYIVISDDRTTGRKHPRIPRLIHSDRNTPRWEGREGKFSEDR